MAIVLCYRHGLDKDEDAPDDLGDAASDNADKGQHTDRMALIGRVSNRRFTIHSHKLWIWLFFF